MGVSSSAGSWKAMNIYRNLLKAVRKHVGKEDYKSHFNEFVAQEFRKSSSISDHTVVKQKLKLARDYTLHLNSLHYYKELLYSYNVAIDRTNEMKKVLGKSAASVGLQLPEVYQP